MDFVVRLLVASKGRLGTALVASFIMAAQLSQDATKPPKCGVKVRQYLAECEKRPRTLNLAKWAVYAYVAQAVTGFAIGLALPWSRLFTQ